MNNLQPTDPPTIGRFRLRGRLGSGGMGQVFLGEAPDGSLAAIKVVHEGLSADSQFRRRFSQEIAAAARIRGARTAAVIESDPEAERPWMASRFIEGRNLLRTVEDDGPLPESSVLELAAGMGEALAVIHATRIVHRDLKPSNVIIADDGPYVIDFGIARAAEASTVTGTGKITGSAAYMSPEQAQGGTVAAPSDIFSLGALLYFAATGESVFGLVNASAMLFRVVHTQPDLSALTDPTLRSLIQACLAKDPAQRPVAPHIPEIARKWRTFEPVAAGESPAPLGHAALPGNATPTDLALQPEQPTIISTSSARPGTSPLVAARRRRLQLAGSALAVGTVALLVAGGLVLARGGDSPHAEAFEPAATAIPSPSASSITTPPEASSPTIPATTAAATVKPAGSVPVVQAAPSSPSDTTTTAADPRPVVTTQEVKKPKKNGPTADPGTDDPPTTKVLQTASSASASLDVSGPVTAKAYFGRLDAVTARLSSSVTFDVSPSFALAHPDVCVQTVVFRGVSGDSAAVYAMGLGSSWGGAENAPSQSVATDNGVIHQQLITPPSASAAGDSYVGSAMLRVDGDDTDSGSYALSLGERGATISVWTFAGTKVTCALS